MAQTPRPSVKPLSFLLVHGAWHGGWCWEQVADRLTRAGCRVLCPTLPGLGDRADELSGDITVQTHVDDLAGVLEAHALDDVVLVGHSYGGIVISGVADRAAHRIRALVFVDGVVVEGGKRWCDAHTAEETLRRLDAAAQAGHGGIPPPDPSRFGVSDAGQAAWVRARLTPQPVGTLVSPLTLTHPLGNGLPLHYIDCHAPAQASLAPTKARLRQQGGWSFSELATGHDAMVSMPDALAEQLLHIGGRSS